MLASATLRLVLTILLLQSYCQGKQKTDSGATARVIGGAPAPRGRFPYICSLRTRGAREHACGGTLIKPQWVLTAAHCVDPAFDGTTGLSPIIYCGIYEREEEKLSKVFAADRTFIHPKWSGKVTDGFDIALIKLNKRYDSSVPHLEAEGNFYTSGSVLSALGWGLNSSASFTDLLQIADNLPFVARDICNEAKYWDGQIKRSMICAGIGVQDTARGDSGGPLLQLDIPRGDYTLGHPSFDLLVGITSFGDETRETFKPGVYTSVSYFRDWIDCIVEEKEECSKDGKGSTGSSDDAKESKSKSIKIISVDENTTLVQVTSKASSIPPEAPGESSAEASESLAEGSEEATQRLEVLLDLCPDVTLQRIITEDFALKRARAAIKKDDFETVAGLLCAGLSPDLESALNNTASTLRSSAFNWTLLGEAARYDAVMSARILIEYGADIEKRNRFNYRPLHVAAKHNSVGVAKLLIDSGANVESDSFSGVTPLHYAAGENALAVAKLLIRKGADVDSRNDGNTTSLHYAAWYNALEVAELLIDAGANTQSKNNRGNTPLHIAAYNGSLKAAEILVDSSADVNAKNNEGLTPLHYAARTNKFDFAKFLIKSGALKTEKDDDGDTPFDQICKDAWPECSSRNRARLQRLLRI